MATIYLSYWRDMGRPRNATTGKFMSKQATSAPKQKQEYSQVLLRIPVDMLSKIEQKKAPWTPRNTWILDAIQDRLEEGYNA